MTITIKLKLKRDSEIPSEDCSTREDVISELESLLDSFDCPEGYEMDSWSIN